MFNKHLRQRCVLFLRARAVSSSANNTNTTPQSPSGTSRALGIAVFSAISLTAAGLGVWQTQRYQWKVDLIENAKKKDKEDSTDASLIIDSDRLRYVGQKVHLTGTFQHDKEITLGLRSPPVGMFGPAAQGLASNPQGYYVITPLVTSDGQVFFVNRGWIPRNLRQWSRPSGFVHITGIVTEAEQGGMFAPENSPKTGRLLWLDERALLAATDHTELSQAFLVDAITTNNNSGKEGSDEFPKPKPADTAHEHYVQPATHAVYAITWFSLASIGAFLTYSMFRRRPIRTIGSKPISNANSSKS